MKEQKIHIVDHFKCLGSSINDKADPDEKERARIGIAVTASMHFRLILCDRSLSIKIRLGFLKCYVRSTLLYVVESCTLKIVTMNRLEAFAMWCFRSTSADESGPPVTTNNKEEEASVYGSCNSLREILSSSNGN
ncbi:hypothetical protein J437_LFUL001612 [Ladona fulva]|uniref:Uncharacterized protein n=1 Tax=Ladona fulva TaxID=123851 RepID=A0A8K0KKT6_LADFU|nr:hypothetical protein J437_LFUL001612 [Ladona fulva]